MRLQVYVLYLITISSLTGCILIRPKQPPCPEWTKTPPPADSTYFYAIGIGESQTVSVARNLARVRATAYMAEAIKTHILTLHREILMMLELPPDAIPDFPEGPIIMDSPTWTDLIRSVSVIIDVCIERNAEQVRGYLLLKASIPEFYNAFLIWVRPRVPMDYYEILSTMLKERVSE